VQQTVRCFFATQGVDKNVAAESAADSQCDPLTENHLIKEKAA
jgi:hypothetical protein